MLPKHAKIIPQFAILEIYQLTMFHKKMSTKSLEAKEIDYIITWKKLRSYELYFMISDNNFPR